MSAATADAKPRLNVPPSMAGALRLDPSSSSRPRLMNNEAPKTPSPSKATTYSDRFIPCRSSSRLHNFHLLGSPGAKDSDTPYSRLLRAELFGAPDSPGGGAASSTTPASPNNLFRFKKDHSPAASTAKPQLAFSSLGSAGEVPSPQKKPRKVPKTPHKVLSFVVNPRSIFYYLSLLSCKSKYPERIPNTTSSTTNNQQVLDAPSLLDDFYLNLVDWSSQNMLAVGLGTCVYLWSASNSKVTKLCDLGPRDSVCAVHWSREGSYLSIGTGLGDVQVYSSFSSPIILSNCHLLLLDKI
jgi:cell division cycle 20-like protein 1, cofactor of APC complex